MFYSCLLRFFNSLRIYLCSFVATLVESRDINQKKCICLFSLLLQSSARRIRPTFNLDKVLNEEGPDEMFPPSATEQPHSHAVASYSTPSCPEVSEETDKPSDSIWIIAASETEETAASGSRLTLKQHPSSRGTDEGNIFYQQAESKTIKTKRGHASRSGCVTKDMGHTVTEAAEGDHTEEPRVQFELAGFSSENNSGLIPEKIDLMTVTVEVETESRTKACFDRNTENKRQTQQLHSSDIQLGRRQCETYSREGTEPPGTGTEAGQTGQDREMFNQQCLNNEEMSSSSGKHVTL